MLLTRAGIDFTVVDSTCDEDAITFPNPQVLALERARAKAAAAVLTAAHRATVPAVVLGADTVVALGNRLFGKPRDRAHAAEMLTQLQGTTHSVYTGHCCLRVDNGHSGEAARIAMTRVTMKPMSAAEIEAYVASGESDDRAGAYAIQETADRYVAELQGSWDTVVGLNVAMSARLYLECTETWPDGYRA